MTIAPVVRKRVLYDTSKRSLICRIPSRQRSHPSAFHTVSSSNLNRPARKVRCRALPHYDRNFSTSVVSSILLPPAVFLGLVGTLWFYKCCMMVLFQNKIIYMPSIPPFSRREEIETYRTTCHPVKWEEKRIKSEDKTELALCTGEIFTGASDDHCARQIVLVYFQGNGASLPPRLPALSSILRRLEKEQSGRPIDERARYTCTALSYRGYWKSKGRPSQRGIELDAKAMLKWIEEYTSNSQRETGVILWGQSLGACVALKALLEYRLMHGNTEASSLLALKGIILETPFVSVREMLAALYPQKWLPYRYLWPFLRSHWDSEEALRRFSAFDTVRSAPILMLQASNDEIVPAEHADKLLAVARSMGLDVTMKVVPNALHNEATSKYIGQTAVTDFINEVATR